MAPENPSKKQASAWFRQFVAAGPIQRIGMLGNAVFNLASNLVEEGVQRASHLLEDAQEAFLEGYDSEVDEAKIVEEEVVDRSGPKGKSQESAQ